MSSLLEQFNLIYLYIFSKTVGVGGHQYEVMELKTHN